MRIPEELHGEIPRELLSKHASDDMLLFTGVLSIFIGIALTYLGLHGRQMWLTVWSIGLVLCAIAMMVAILIS